MTRYHVIFAVLFCMNLTSYSQHQTEPMIVAHRGASFDAPENTIPAFLLAWEQGADAIEGDFFLTSDGEIVCIHDHTTGRVAGKNLIVHETSLKELQKLDVGLWKGKKWKGTRIPTIAEVFATVPDDKMIFVEIKPGVEILPGMYGEIERSGLRPDQIVIISFNPEVIRDFKLKRPDIKAYWLTALRSDENGVIFPSHNLLMQILRITGADGISTHHSHITKPFVEKTIAAGFEYHVWTVNNPERAAELKEYGTLSITTDIPQVIREHLRKQ